MSAFVVLLAGTGIALNHTQELDLDDRYVRNRTVLEWYGIEPPASADVSHTDKGRVILLGTKLYVETRPLEGDFRRLNGAVALHGSLIVAVDDDLLLLTANGDFAERLSEGDGVPAAVKAIGVDSHRRLIARTSAGDYRSNALFLDWQPLNSDATTAWDSPQRVSGPAIAAMQIDYLGRVLPWERVILDLHSGRLFGTPGPWLMDAAGFLLLILAGSGVFLWWRRQR